MALPVPITALYASLLALLVVMLSVVVIRLRRTLRVGVGDGGNRDLARAIRVQGNAIEYVPIFLILLAVYELNHGTAAGLHAFGALFFSCRILHAWGLYGSGGASRARVAGIVGTLAALILLSLANLLKLFGA
ncbi:MAG: MAPEG family protein [Betaproteobacteria bacterium]